MAAGRHAATFRAQPVCACRFLDRHYDRCQSANATSNAIVLLPEPILLLVSLRVDTRRFMGVLCFTGRAGYDKLSNR